MIVKVFYKNVVTDELEYYADIKTSLTGEDACEYAFRRTSWSMGQYYDDGETNYDYDPDITVKKPLEMYNGKFYGHRSSMVGDVFEIDGVRYECRRMGFKKI